MSDVAQVSDDNHFRVARRAARELVVTGDLDLATAPELRTAFTELGGNEPVTVDLAELTFIDSSGIHALLRCARDLDGGAPLVLANVPDWALRLFEITRITESGLFELRGTDGG